MNRDDIIRMAREAGWTGPEENVTYVAMLERFANLVAAAKREVTQEPAAYMDMYGQVYNPHELNGELRIKYLMKMQDAPTPLYYAPPQREWQGLTDEEIKQLWKDTPQLVGVYSYTDIAREVEAKLKEKNP